MGMIIVEGLDNSGKSTLVRKLAFSLSRASVVSVPPTQGIDAMRHFCFASVAHTNMYSSLIFDRHANISEPVYGPVVRDRDEIQLWQEDPNYIAAGMYTMFSALWNKRRPTIVFCDPGLASILEFGEREQMEGVIDNAEVLYHRYHNHMKRFELDGCRVIPYNYNVDSYTQLLGRLTE